MPLFYTSELFNGNFNFTEAVYKYHLNRHLQNKSFCDIEHGRKVLSSAREVDVYGSLYAASHEQKLNEAYDALNLSRLRGQIIETISYGCGMATDTNVLISYLMRHNINLCLERLTLIEPSQVAIDCGVKHIHNALLDPRKSLAIKTHAKYLEQLTPEDLSFTNPNAKLHVFSNILDVAQVDLVRLASLIATNISGHNYFVCVSPNNPGTYDGKDRIDRFHSLLAQELKLSDININDQPTQVASYNHKRKQVEMSNVTRYHRIFHAYAG